MKPIARNHEKRRFAARAAPDPSAPVWLWGQHAVEAAIANRSREILRCVATENAARRTGFAQAEIMDPKALDKLLPPGAVHQGLAVKVNPLAPVALDECIARVDAPDRVCVLDQLSDPHNLGAIFRSAAAFGVGAMILQTRHTPLVTGVAAKAAAGAIEAVEEVRVVNIARAIDALGEAGYHTVGLAGEGIETVADAVSGARKIAFVMGAEGSGLRPAVAKACAQLARIPMTPGMESLNVSNAAAIAFYEAMRNRENL
ncbi:TrmH family RNA methyltransferase [Henriciella litoralis]|uniref:TrmH family RNA methyltransferase n=1 Tax=Henriciella litoralis TaxID=568102 RepID=UPI000A06E7B6|nr:RNA methyltransferase [Henriciella litoralis]